MNAPFPVAVCAAPDSGGKAVIVCNDQEALIKACEALLAVHPEIVVRKMTVVIEHPTIKVKGDT